MDTSSPNGRPLLEVRNLTKKFKRREVLKCVNFDINEHDILAIFGPNGAGKTTLLHILGGLWYASSGTMLWHGAPYSGRTACNIGIVWDHPVLHDGWTAWQHLTYYGQLYGVPGDYPAKLLRRLGLTAYAHIHIKAFSLGMKKRLSLGMALLKHPQLLLLDEPISGLDPLSAKSFMTFLQVHQKQQGASVVVSHDLSDILALCTRYGVLVDGQLRFGPRANIDEAKEWITDVLSDRDSIATF